MMPFADIQLLFETLVQRTRELCKCEKRHPGSKKSKREVQFFREPIAGLRKTLLWLAAAPDTALDMARRAP
jgi:hypothetical protein